MKQLESKDTIWYQIRRRFRLLAISVKFSIQSDMAYLFGYWSNMLSTFFYVLSAVIFIDILYGNVNSIAGYSKAEMFFYLFVGQITFYLHWGLNYSNMRALTKSVNTGTFDNLLVKPVPLKYFISIKNIMIVKIIRDSILPMVLVIFFVPWNELDITGERLVYGTILFILGFICLHCYFFIIATLVFWFESNENLGMLSWTIYSYAGGEIPFEGFKKGMKMIFSTILPVLITTGFSVSVTLGKSDPKIMILWAGAVTVVALIVRSLMWRISLRRYSSVSS